MDAAVGRWGVRRRRGVLEVAYGRGGCYPQHAALHLDSGYLRLTYGPSGGWGTSIVLPPAFWAGGVYHQGAPVRATWQEAGADLVVSFAARLGGLRVRGEVRLAPPGGDRLEAAVAVRVGGAVSLDDRPGEAFKPVLLSSMRTGPDRWDARAARLDGSPLAIPDTGPVLPAGSAARRLGLVGGTSAWKRGAPTVEIALDRTLSAGGWVTPSDDPNDDNVALWAAAPGVLPVWRYRASAVAPGIL